MIVARQRVEIHSFFSHDSDKMSFLSMILSHLFFPLIFVKFMIHYHQSEQMDGGFFCVLCYYLV